MRHGNCATCEFSNYISSDGYNITCYCSINNEKIEYPSEMGGSGKCPCYVSMAECRKANAKRERERKKRVIENHVYPQKSEAEKV